MSLSLVFVGGIADSGKSKLIELVTNQLTDITALRVSDSLRVALDAAKKNPKPELGPEVTFIDWKHYEDAALRDLVSRLKIIINGNTKTKTVIVNTHFATYSPGGFMVGLDPASIAVICKTCQLTDGADSPGKAAVVLVDLGIADVLHRREERWTEKADGFPRGSALVQDLEFNRMYALQYHGVLTSLIQARALYKRIHVDYTSKHDLGPLEEDLKKAAFKFATFLTESGFSGEEYTL